MASGVKHKTKPAQAHNTGVFKTDSIKDVAESLGIAVLSDTVASSLASDVEYRLHQIIEEASRFMRHGRRTTLTTSDIDQALRVLNIEPLYGHSPFNPPTFRRAVPYPNAPAAGAVYYVEDEEIDFDHVLREEKIALPKGVSWTAHWLAVEGVQPAVPENPPVIPRDQGDQTDTKAGVTKTNGVGSAGPSKLQQQQQQLVKQVLSRELQLYYTRLTTTLLPPSNDIPKRAAALASLRQDAGLQALLPYLIRWVSEGVVSALRSGAREGPQAENDGRILEVLVEVLSALLDNNTLFVEPYLHQVLPPILSTLLHSSLPRSHSTLVRTSSAQTLSRMLRQHSTTYPSLAPRIMKTLLLALISPGKSHATRDGAVRGLICVGKEAVRKGLIESGGARIISSEADGSPESNSAMSAVSDALLVLKPPSLTDDINMDTDIDVLATQLETTLGSTFAAQVVSSRDALWATAILGTGSGPNES
ncbi:transcription initiation factor TFIID complex 60 kDa subunit [Flagelloscypha sp. PMI_526]|nr:transcription initiation factor TFIID complex 60 kDa subunit [Flagelloscypha sp. PMI_526]